MQFQLPDLESIELFLIMRGPCTQLFVHVVWSTWDRLPLIIDEIEARLYASIAGQCQKLKCVPQAIGGMPDHIHLLAMMDPKISVATLVKEVKGASSHLITHEVLPREFFKWQGGYGAFTIEKKNLSYVSNYILSQKQHYVDNSLIVGWEPGIQEFDGFELADRRSHG